MKRTGLLFLILFSVFILAGELSVTFLNVNQGDGIVIRAPDGKVFLIDAGQPEYYDKEKNIYYSRFDAGRDIVAPYLKSQGITEIEGILGTHPDADHIGGLVYILKNFPVKKAYYTGKLHTSNIFNEFLELIDKNGVEYIEVRAGDILDWSPDILVNAVGPTEDEVRNSSNNNNTSIVLYLKYGNVSFMLTGDAETEMEERIVDEYGNAVGSQVLKLGHHGSKSSSCYEFLSAVSPEYVIFSCGKNNKFGFPHAEMIKRLCDAVPDVKIVRTDYNGNITFVTDGTGITVTPEKGGLYTMEELLKMENISYVPSRKPLPKPEVKKETEKTTPAPAPLPQERSDRININTASQSELETLPRIGPAIAKNIIDYRDQNGSFKTIEEIKNVPRIGEKTFQNIKDMITVGGAAPAAKPVSSPAPVPAADEENGRININTASQSELETLPRIGPAIAKNIIDYRDQNGSFKTIEEIKNVPRIGEKTFQNLKELITVGGNKTFTAAGNPAAPAATAPLPQEHSDRININTASQSELETLPRIGPTIARNIIEYREKNGPFKDISEIKNVSRIGEKTFQNIKDLITVSGSSE